MRKEKTNESIVVYTMTKVTNDYIELQKFVCWRDYYADQIQPNHREIH